VFTDVAEIFTVPLSNVNPSRIEVAPLTLMEKVVGDADDDVMRVRV
jgi:hypothetical protein